MDSDYETERGLKRIEDDNEKMKSIRAAESERDELMEKIRRSFNDHCNPNTPKSMKYGVRK